MDTTPPADVLVEQRHRDAAADQARWLIDAQKKWDNMPIWFASDFPRACRRGVWDNHEFVQAFARFERDYLAIPLQGGDDVRAAWESVKREFGHSFRDGTASHYPEVVDMDRAVAALRPAPSADDLIERCAQIVDGLEVATNSRFTHSAQVALAQAATAIRKLKGSSDDR